MARPKGSKNKPQVVDAENAQGSDAPPMADCPGLIEYVGPEGCVQFRGVEFERGVAREVPADIFAALSTRAAFKVA